MKSHLARPVAALAVGASLILTGCGSADKAAEVNGTVITESEAQDAASQIVQAFNPSQGYTTGDAVASLIVAPMIIERAAHKGAPVSESSARWALAHPAQAGVQGGKPISDPSTATIELVQADSAFRSLTDEDKLAIVDQLKKAKVEVNPRYGTFDASKGTLERSAPAWIESVSTPSGTPAQ